MKAPEKNHKIIKVYKKIVFLTIQVVIYIYIFTWVIIWTVYKQTGVSMLGEECWGVVVGERFSLGSYVMIGKYLQEMSQLQVLIPPGVHPSFLPLCVIAPGLIHHHGPLYWGTRPWWRRHGTMLQETHWFTEVKNWISKMLRHDVGICILSIQLIHWKHSHCFHVPT